MTNLCSVAGCKAISHARGFCSSHYSKLKRHGNPLMSLRNKKGTGTLSRGYRLIQVDGKRKFEHVVIAEKVLGKKLPSKAAVHHVNGIKDDNRNSNLVICPDAAYHNMLHVRIAAKKACGDPNKRTCSYCKKYDLISSMSKKVDVQNNSFSFYHKDCARLKWREKNHNAPTRKRMVGNGTS